MAGNPARVPLHLPASVLLARLSCARCSRCGWPRSSCSSPWRFSIRGWLPPLPASPASPSPAVGAALMLFLALRGQDRALSLGAELDAAAGVAVRRRRHVHGQARRATSSCSAWPPASCCIVVLIGFTVTQYAFRSFEPLYGAQPDDEKLRSLAVDGAGAAVWEWNARRDEIKVSPLVEAILGLKAGMLSAKTTEFLRYMHPADAERLKVLMWSVREQAGGEMRLDLRHAACR